MRFPFSPRSNETIENSNKKYNFRFPISVERNNVEYRILSYNRIVQNPYVILVNPESGHGLSWNEYGISIPLTNLNTVFPISSIRFVFGLIAFVVSARALSDANNK